MQFHESKVSILLVCETRNKFTFEEKIFTFERYIKLQKHFQKNVIEKKEGQNIP